ncbi:hypothetical protein EG347_02590 [Chryseobacterium sp. G0186]|uniref:hypothetical protein n=1 Tax=Chryseobacterium sp. G0186 TaxID=2487064 RepID=UPI000F4D96BB|nr:hypothetical protein [Chryseobacterium sp. G0186]AZA76488.1 hypothetical protein EG347_02590 [Chryseobacterium sp. G0186]
MDFFKLKRIVFLNYKKKVAISGTIINDINKPMSEFSRIIVNNTEVVIQEVNEVLIDDHFYIAFTFDSLDAVLLQDIMHLNEGHELKII